MTVISSLLCTIQDLTPLFFFERPETITIGTDPAKLPPALARLMAGQLKKGAIPPKWDGKAAERVVESLEPLLQNIMTAHPATLEHLRQSTHTTHRDKPQVGNPDARRARAY
jgi:hypothetical protein